MPKSASVWRDSVCEVGGSLEDENDLARLPALDQFSMFTRPKVYKRSPSPESRWLTKSYLCHIMWQRGHRGKE